MVFLIRALDRRGRERERRVDLAGPHRSSAGRACAARCRWPRRSRCQLGFPQRDLIIFLTFAVIFATLVLQGLTLPALIRRLGVADDGVEAREELLGAPRRDGGRARAARRAGRGGVDARRHGRAHARRSTGTASRRLAARAGEGEEDGDGIEDRSLKYQKMVREVLEAQRAELVRLRNEGEISNEVMHRLERELDLEEERLEI